MRRRITVVSMEKRITVVAAMACVMGSCALLNVTGQEAPKGVRYVLEYYENGQAKTQIKAASVMPGETNIKAKKVRGECYTEEGKLDILILADQCEYSKDELLVVGDSNVTVEKDDITLSGTGFKWDGKQQVVEINSNVKLAFLRKGSVKSLRREPPKEVRLEKKEAVSNR